MLKYLKLFEELEPEEIKSGITVTVPLTKVEAGKDTETVIAPLKVLIGKKLKEIDHNLTWGIGENFGTVTRNTRNNTYYYEFSLTYNGMIDGSSWETILYPFTGDEADARPIRVSMDNSERATWLYWNQTENKIYLLR